MNQTIFPRNRRNGYTLLELTIALAISVSVMGLGVGKYLDFNNKQSVISEGLTIKSHLREIQSKAISGIKPAAGCTSLESYRVTYQAAFYQAQAICDNGTAVAPITRYNLRPGFTFSAPSAGTRVNFKVLGNGTDTTGASSVITIRQSSTRYYSMCVSVGGDITECGYGNGSPVACSC